MPLVVCTVRYLKERLAKSSEEKQELVDALSKHVSITMSAM